MRKNKRKSKSKQAHTEHQKLTQTHNKLEAKGQSQSTVKQNLWKFRKHDSKFRVIPERTFCLSLVFSIGPRRSQLCTRHCMSFMFKETKLETGFQRLKAHTDPLPGCSCQQLTGESQPSRDSREESREVGEEKIGEAGAEHSRSAANGGRRKISAEKRIVQSKINQIRNQGKENHRIWKQAGRKSIQKGQLQAEQKRTEKRELQVGGEFLWTHFAFHFYL